MGYAILQLGPTRVQRAAGMVVGARAAQAHQTQVRRRRRAPSRVLVRAREWIPAPARHWRVRQSCWVRPHRRLREPTATLLRSPRGRSAPTHCAIRPQAPTAGQTWAPCPALQQRSQKHPAPSCLLPLTDRPRPQPRPRRPRRSRPTLHLPLSHLLTSTQRRRQPSPPSYHPSPSQNPCPSRHGTRTRSTRMRSSRASSAPASTRRPPRSS